MSTHTDTREETRKQTYTKHLNTRPEKETLQWLNGKERSKVLILGDAFGLVLC